MPLKAVDLFHIRYEADDRVGKLLAWASLLPVLIAFAGFPGHVLARRELRTIAFCLGTIASEAANQVLKRTLRMPRPMTCEALEMCESHGMPSSHAQYMCFFALYMTLLVLRHNTYDDGVSKVLSATLPWPFALLTMISRVYLGYHTLSQVMAGACVGLAGAILWYTAVERVSPTLFPWLETLPLFRYLCVRDSTHIPNIVRFEYEAVLASRRAHLTKRE
eukprot:SM000289S10408  [mRNA]  locus=s289:26730:28027:+ [translate_table: standard]